MILDFVTLVIVVANSFRTSKHFESLEITRTSKICVMKLLAFLQERVRAGLSTVTLTNICMYCICSYM